MVNLGPDGKRKSYQNQDSIYKHRLKNGTNP